MEGEGGSEAPPGVAPTSFPPSPSLCSTAGSVPALLSSPTLQKFLAQRLPNSVKLAKAPNLLFQPMLFSLSWLYEKLILSTIN